MSYFIMQDKAKAFEQLEELVDSMELDTSLVISRIPSGILAQVFNRHDLGCKKQAIGDCMLEVVTNLDIHSNTNSNG